MLQMRETQAPGWFWVQYFWYEGRVGKCYVASKTGIIKFQLTRFKITFTKTITFCLHCCWIGNGLRINKQSINSIGEPLKVGSSGLIGWLNNRGNWNSWLVARWAHAPRVAVAESRHLQRHLPISAMSTQRKHVHTTNPWSHRKHAYT